jgi:Zn-dependent protease with chaperone function
MRRSRKEGNAMKLGPLSALVLCSLLAPASMAEGEGEDIKPRASGPASGPSLTDRLKGLMPSKGGPAAQATPDSPKASNEPKASTSTATSTPMKIKEIDKVSKVSSKVIDAHCKNLVEPFGLTDNAASLGMLQAKLKVQSFLGSSGTGGAPGDKNAVRLAARQLNWMPMSVERMIGKDAHDKKDQSGELLDARKGAKAYSNAKAILAKVVAQVGEPHPYDFSVHVVKRSQGNAEAAPGGFVYVDRDLVEKPENEPRATFAIAHEVAHVLQRHQTRELQARLTDGIDSMEGLQKVISSANGSPNALLLRARELKRLFMLHSEEQELQSDACAVRMLDSMMSDKRKLVAAIEAFVKALPPSQPSQKVASQQPEDVMKELGDGKFSSHPNTTVRAQNLATMLREVSAKR